MMFRGVDMEIEVIRSEKNLLEFYIEGERHTFTNLLKSRLLEDKDVDFASYVLDHPTSSKAKFVLRTSGKTPKKALDDASKKIEEDLDELEKLVKKALK